MVQHALLPSHSPLEKTPHNAGVVSVALMAAVVTLLEMPAENGSSANLDRGHDTALRHRKRSAMLLAIGCAVAAEHVGHFESRPIHFPELTVLRSSGFRLSASRPWGQIEGTDGGAHLGGSDA
jgi:hypothetical protein